MRTVQFRFPLRCISASLAMFGLTASLPAYGHGSMPLQVPDAATEDETTAQAKLDPGDPSGSAAPDQNDTVGAPTREPALETSADDPSRIEEPPAQAPLPASTESSDSDSEDGSEGDSDSEDGSEGDSDSEDDASSETAAVLESPVPDRLSKYQKGAWWTVLAAAALGSAAGVLAGFAEREEDRALRLATRFDLESGSQLLYADVQEEYEGLLDRGRSFDRSAIALGAVAGAAAIAAITVFIVDARRRHKRGERGSSAKRWDISGFEVRF